MASETTFDHWKVVFSWGKMRKSRFSQNPLNARFWAFGFLIYTSSSANLKKIHLDTSLLSHCMFLPLVQSHHYNLQNHRLHHHLLSKEGSGGCQCLPCGSWTNRGGRQVAGQAGNAELSNWKWPQKEGTFAQTRQHVRAPWTMSLQLQETKWLKWE